MPNRSRTWLQLQPEDRVTLARRIKPQNDGVREIACVRGRSASTISRELRRNANAGQYGSTAVLPTTARAGRALA